MEEGAGPPAPFAAVLNFNAEGDGPAAERCIAALAAALADEPVAAYLTLSRGDRRAGERLWAERLRLWAQHHPGARQFYCLADLSATAVLLELPAQAVPLLSSMARLAPLIPLKLWSAFARFEVGADRQRAAFAQPPRGPYWCVAALGAAPDAAPGAVAALLAHLCAAADGAQEVLFAEVPAAGRAAELYRAAGFAALWQFQPRALGPRLFAMARQPRPLASALGGSGAAAAGGRLAARAAVQSRSSAEAARWRRAAPRRARLFNYQTLIQPVSTRMARE
jgi:hypothetical protein